MSDKNTENKLAYIDFFSNFVGCYSSNSRKEQKTHNIFYIGAFTNYIREDMEKQDMVSIIMPTYNCADYIIEAINSVKGQTYKNWELLIVDDCSADNTKDIVSKMQADD